MLTSGLAYKTSTSLLQDAEAGCSHYVLLTAHQAEDGYEASPPVVVAAAELQVEQQSVVRHQVKTVCVHQGLTAQSVARLEARRVDPTWTGMM